MGGLGCPVVQAQVVAAGGFKALMTQDFLNVTDRAAIEEKLCRGGMA
jgi:hypothetical protein